MKYFVLALVLLLPACHSSIVVLPATSEWAYTSSDTHGTAYIEQYEIYGTQPNGERARVSIVCDRYDGIYTEVLFTAVLHNGPETTNRDVQIIPANAFYPMQVLDNVANSSSLSDTANQSIIDHLTELASEPYPGKLWIAAEHGDGSTYVVELSLHGFNDAYSAACSEHPDF